MWITETNIFTRDHHQPSSYIQRILSSSQHPGLSVKSCQTKGTDLANQYIAADPSDPRRHL